jgi:hypothetical protein
MSKYRPSPAVYLGNTLFATILGAPHTELLDLEIASEHDIEVELVHRTLDRYVSSEWLTVTLKPNPMRPTQMLRLYAVSQGYHERKLQPPEAPRRQAEAPLRAPKRDRAATVDAVLPPMLKATPSEAVPSEPPLVEPPPPVIAPAAKPAAKSEEIKMPRGVYQRNKSATQDKNARAFSCAIFDDDRLLIRAGGKSIELEPGDTERLAAYLRRIGRLHDFALTDLASTGVDIDRAHQSA